MRRVYFELGVWMDSSLIIPGIDLDVLADKDAWQGLLLLYEYLYKMAIYYEDVPTVIFSEELLILVDGLLILLND